MRAWARRTGAFVALPLVAAACAAPGDEPYERAPTERTRQAIIGGTPSTAARDATVLVNDAGSRDGCSGTLIAPNLVLTARHCVTDFNLDDECGLPLGNNAPASVLSISVGVYASRQQAVARATKLFVPTSETGLCGADLALLLLDKDVPNAKIARVRFEAPALREAALAVGYGDGDGRRERSVQVLALGPGTETYTTRNGSKLPMNLPGQDFATGESTCFGDSGGPLLDSAGRVIGVASRGIDERCDDRPTIWTSVAAHRQLIVDAAKAAGHPLEGTASGNQQAIESGNEGRSTSDPELEGDEENAPSPPKKSSTSLASSGCEAASPPATSSPMAAGSVLVALGLCALRTRARGHRSHRRLVERR